MSAPALASTARPTYTDISERYQGVGVSEQVLIRALEPGTKSRLKRIADRHGRSVEADLRELVENYAEVEDGSARSPWLQFLDDMERFREEHGGVELERPEYLDYVPRDPFA